MCGIKIGTFAIREIYKLFLEQGYLAQKGEKVMWFEGFMCGVILSAGIMGGGHLIYRAVTRERRHARMIENFGVLYDAGYRAGQNSNEK